MYAVAQCAFLACLEKDACRVAVCVSGVLYADIDCVCICLFCRSLHAGVQETLLPAWQEMERLENEDRAAYAQKNAEGRIGAQVAGGISMHHAWDGCDAHGQCEWSGCRHDALSTLAVCMDARMHGIIVKMLVGRLVVGSLCRYACRFACVCVWHRVQRACG